MASRRSKIPEGFFSIQQAVQITGVIARTLRDWIAKGVILPAGGGGKRGKPILLSFKNLLEIRIVAKLREVVSLQRVRRVLEHLAKMGYDSPTDVYMLDASSDEIKICMTPETKISAEKRVGQLYLIDVMEVKQEIKQGVVKCSLAA
ncbi:MAG: MerR family transcriptional regulator [Armatimonadetes bacterium]|nr:MerR family transcriptional regulator [Armatimonadota bacterium]